VLGGEGFRRGCEEILPGKEGKGFLTPLLMKREEKESVISYRAGDWQVFLGKKKFSY